MMKTIRTTLAMLLVAAMAVPASGQAAFKVNGTEYSADQNYSDLLDDGGSLSFNVETNTLTMNNCTGLKSVEFLEPGNKAPRTVKIELVGENEITASAYCDYAISYPYGDIVIMSDYTGSLLMTGQGLNVGIKAGGDGSTGTPRSVTIKDCDLSIIAQNVPLEIPGGKLIINAANVFLSGGQGLGDYEREYGNADEVAETSESLRTKRYIAAYVDMGSDNVGDRTYDSIEECLLSKNINPIAVTELAVNGAITGKDIDKLREMGTTGNLENLNLLMAVVRYTGDDNYDYANRLMGSKVTADRQLPRNAFYSAEKITKLQMPITTQSIGMYAFTGTSIERLLLFDYLETLENGALLCNTLKILDIEGTFGSIWSEDQKIDFLGGGGLLDSNVEEYRVNKDIDYSYWNVSTSTEEEPAFLRSLNGVLYTADMKKLVRYPSGNKNSQFEIPACVEELCEHSFDGTIHLSSLVVPETVKRIGYGAFWRARSLNRLFIYNATSLNDHIFAPFTYLQEEGYFAGLDLFLCTEAMPSSDFFGTEYDDYSDVLQNIRVHVPYQSLDDYKTLPYLEGFTILPMLLGTGDSTPFFYDKGTLLSMDDWTPHDDYTNVGAYIAVGIDKKTSEALMFNLNAGNGAMIPAKTAVVVKPTRAGGVYPMNVFEMTGSGSQSVDVYGTVVSNLLVGVANPTTVQPAAGSTYNYLLDGEQFRRMTASASMSEGSVYLQTTYKSQVLGQREVTYEELQNYVVPTAINEHHVATGNAEWRNLNGQRVDKPQRGIYINGNKKVIVR